MARLRPSGNPRGARGAPRKARKAAGKAKKGRVAPLATRPSMTLPEAWKAFDAATKRITHLEDLYIEKATRSDQEFVKLYARLDKLEKTQMARDDKELANYTRQVTDIDVKVNGMANNIRAYDHRIVEAEAKAANAAEASEPATRSE